ncbi:unnamed protein product [Discosporangium mesarthrocarpum]
MSILAGTRAFISGPGRAMAVPSSAAGSSRGASNFMCNLFGLGGGPSVSAKSIFEFTVKDYQGNDFDLGTYEGKKKAFLVVNVASK